MPKLPNVRHFKSILLITTAVLVLSILLGTLHLITNSPHSSPSPKITSYDCFRTCSQLKESRQISDQSECIGICQETIGLTTEELECNLTTLLTTSCPQNQAPRCVNAQIDCVLAAACWLPWGDSCQGPDINNCHAAISFYSSTQCLRFLQPTLSSTTHPLIQLVNLLSPAPTPIPSQPTTQLSDECHNLTNRIDCANHPLCHPITLTDGTFSYCLATYQPSVSLSAPPASTNPPSFFHQLTRALVQRLPWLNALLTQSTAPSFESLRYPSSQSFISFSTTGNTPANLDQYLTTQNQARSIIIDGLETKSYLSYDQFTTWLKTIHQVAATGIDGTLINQTISHPGEFRTQDLTLNHPQEATEVAAIAAKYKDSFATTVNQSSPQSVNLPNLPPEALPTNIGTRHFSPKIQYLPDYLHLMHQTFSTLSTLPLKTDQTTLLHTTALYYQFAINAHPFEQLNHEVFIGQVNVVLELHGLRPVPYGYFDHAARRLQPDNFAQYFSDWTLSHQ